MSGPEDKDDTSEEETRQEDDSLSDYERSMNDALEADISGTTGG